MGAVIGRCERPLKHLLKRELQYHKGVMHDLLSADQAGVAVAGFGPRGGRAS